MSETTPPSKASSIEKAQLRVKVLSAREIAAGGFTAQAHALFAENCAALLKTLSGCNSFCVAGYYPIRDEIDILPVLEALHRGGVPVAMPVIRPGPSLLFRSWVPGTPLVTRQFGLREPPDGNPIFSPRIVLVPLVAFDSSGNRLGYGAGYYDAGLRALRGESPTIAVGTAFDEQEVSAIPREPQDELLDYIVTPSRIVDCS